MIFNRNFTEDCSWGVQLTNFHHWFRSDPMLASLLTHICVTRPQWVINDSSKHIEGLTTWMTFFRKYFWNTILYKDILVFRFPFHRYLFGMVQLKMSPFGLGNNFMHIRRQAIKKASYGPWQCVKPMTGIGITCRSNDKDINEAKSALHQLCC